MAVVSTREFFRVLTVTFYAVITILYCYNNVKLACDFIDRLHYSLRLVRVYLTIRPLSKDVFFFLGDICEFPTVLKPQ